MTFIEGLLNSGYTYDPQVGSYVKEGDNGLLHTYMHIEGDTWKYQMYDSDYNVTFSKEFSI